MPASSVVKRQTVAKRTARSAPMQATNSAERSVAARPSLAGISDGPSHPRQEHPAVVLANQLEALPALLALPALAEVGHELEADVVLDVHRRAIAVDADVAIADEIAQPAQRRQPRVEHP